MCNRMNTGLKNQIINFKKKEVSFNWENFHGTRHRETINLTTKKRYSWYKYNFRFIKKYNNECATNLGCGKKYLLSKKDLLIWCEINNIKCAKSKKYSNIVKLLIESIFD